MPPSANTFGWPGSAYARHVSTRVRLTRRGRVLVALVSIGVLAVGGIAVFLGVPPVPSLVAGLVAGVLFGGLILAAARRSASFHDDPDRGGNDPTR